MGDVLLTNIFFIITSIAVVAVTVMIGIILYYIIQILRAFRDVAERVRHGSEVVAEDVKRIRAEFTTGNIISKIVSRVISMGSASPKRRATKEPKETDNHS